MSSMVNPKAEEEAFRKHVVTHEYPGLVPTGQTAKYMHMGAQLASFMAKQAGGEQVVRNIRDLAVSQADMFTKTADYIRKLGQKDVDAYRVTAAEQIGGVRATYAYGGVRVGTGTTLSTVIAAKRRHKFNELYIQHSRFIQARAYEDRATLALMEGNQRAYDQQVGMFKSSWDSMLKNTALFDLVGKGIGLGEVDLMGMLDVFKLAEPPLSGITSMGAILSGTGMSGRRILGPTGPSYAGRGPVADWSVPLMGMVGASSSGKAWSPPEEHFPGG